jgi:hypothetical protein
MQMLSLPLEGFSVFQPVDPLQDNTLKFPQLKANMDQFLESDIVYRPLESNSNEFRLLKLLKKNGELPSCELFHSSLEKNPGYEALSYTWGDATLQGKIQLNGYAQPVTQNLAQAFADIQSLDSDRILWVDALCINQGNLAERNHQVKQMGKIYQSAKRVLVWLGRPEITFRNGLSSLHVFITILLSSGAIHDSTDDDPSSGDAIHRLFKSMQRGDYWDEWHDLAVLCELPYWNRLWIVQEIGLASDIEVYYGNCSIDWQIFGRLAETLAQLVHQKSLPKPFLSIAKIILESMPARLEQQRSYQFPPWLQKLHRDLRLSSRIANAALISAYIFFDLWNTALHLSKHERGELGLPNFKTYSDNAITLTSEKSVSLLLDKSKHQDLLASCESILENCPDDWKLPPKFAEAISILPAHLEHVTDHQRKEFDENFLQEIDHLKSTFNALRRLRFDFVYYISIEERNFANADDSNQFPQLRRLAEMKADVLRFSQLCSTLSRQLEHVPLLLSQHREQQKPAFRFDTLLENCERSLCQEPRDKIYGLLGLASNVRDGEIVVDYSKSMFKLYEDVMAHYLASQGSIDSEYSKSTDLARFSQLLQRSLSGPFWNKDGPQQNHDINVVSNCTGSSTIRVDAFLKGSILPLEPALRLETPVYTIDQERMVILQSYFGATVGSHILLGEISRILRQLRAVDRDRIVPPSQPSNNASSQFQQQRATSRLPHLNYPRLFSEASGLVGIAGSSIREDDLPGWAPIRSISDR